jgi:hypothetical protein
MNKTNLELNLLDNPVTSTFARHETFHPRWGWLKKGFDAASNDSHIFNSEDAPVRLGVGKNMVRSLRYWCYAFKIINDDNIPSVFGNNLLGVNGWDTYLENPASLWLLHWNLLKPICNASAWYYTFNLFNENEFKKEDLLKGLNNYLKELKKTVAESSLQKDINCILRMYVESDNQNINFVEDSIDCPFTELGLIYQPKNSIYYRFRFGSKPNLPPEIIVATCLEYASWVSQNQSTITISRLLYDKGSPGIVFKLTEEAIYSAIETISRQESSLFLADTAGLVQLSFEKNSLDLANQILDRYYDKVN